MDISLLAQHLSDWVFIGDKPKVQGNTIIFDWKKIKKKFVINVDELFDKLNKEPDFLLLKEKKEALESAFANSPLKEDLLFQMYYQEKIDEAIVYYESYIRNYGQRILIEEYNKK